MRIDMERVLAAVEGDENTGFCTACGEEAEGVEPDACNYECEYCGAASVFGAEGLLLEFFPN